jgi:hypothetical protein
MILHIFTDSESAYTLAINMNKHLLLTGDTSCPYDYQNCECEHLDKDYMHDSEYIDEVLVILSNDNFSKKEKLEQLIDKSESLHGTRYIRVDIIQFN